jgi:hypothetical protein
LVTHPTIPAPSQMKVMAINSVRISIVLIILRKNKISSSVQSKVALVPPTALIGIRVTNGTKIIDRIRIGFN